MGRREGGNDGMMMMMDADEVVGPREEHLLGG